MFVVALPAAYWVLFLANSCLGHREWDLGQKE